MKESRLQSNLSIEFFSLVIKNLCIVWKEIPEWSIKVNPALELGLTRLGNLTFYNFKINQHII